MEKTDPKTSNKQSLLKILGGVSPEIDFSDDEVLFGHILDDYNAYAELLDRESEHKKNEDSLEVEYRHNMAASMAEIEQMTSDESLDADEVDHAIAELKRISAETASGLYTTANVRMMLGVLHREADIEAARCQGEIDGRNAAIDTCLHTAPDGDGLPMLSGANTGVTRHTRSIFDIARE